MYSLLTTRRLICLALSRRVSTEASVLVSETNGVRRITLNNEVKRNALSLQVLQTLHNSMTDSPSLRCVVIAANGRVFSAGHDLNELSAAADESHRRRVFDTCGQLMCAIRELEVPVVCQVRGMAVAAGCQLVAACDIAMAGTGSRFSTPGASVGLFCSTPGVAVSRSANAKTAAFMLFTGNAITAEEALRSGLVSRVVSDERLEEETQHVVNAILSKSKSVIALGKRFFYAQLRQDLSEAYQNGSTVMCDNLRLVDANEGISAFFSKRQPKWSHTKQTVC